MKKLILLFLIFISNRTETLSAQSIGSLKLALKNAKHDTTRCNILNVLAETTPDGEWEKFNSELLNLRVMVPRHSNI